MGGGPAGIKTIRFFLVFKVKFDQFLFSIVLFSKKKVPLELEKLKPQKIWVERLELWFMFLTVLNKWIIR